MENGRGREAMGQAIYPRGSLSSCSLCPMGKNVPGLTLPAALASTLLSANSGPAS